MRLQAEGPPNAADGHAAEPGGFSHAARAPMRLSTGRAFQGLNDDPLDCGIADLAGRSRSGLVVESFQASFQKPRTPLAHHAQRGGSFRATALLSSPSAQASTTRARRANNG